MAQAFKMISFRVSVEEKKLLEERALKAGKSPHVWFREVAGGLGNGALGSESSMTAVEVCKRLGVSPRTLNTYVRVGGLPSTGTGRERRFVWDSVMRWFRAGGENMAGKQPALDVEWDRQSNGEVPANAEIRLREVERRLCVSRRMLHAYVHELGMPMKAAAGR